MKKLLSIVLSLALLLMVMPFGVFTASAESVATDTWDGTFTEPTTVDADGNYVIYTAEELAWIALRGGDATANKNYIVAPNSVFDLGGMEGITPDSALADVKAATKSTTNVWRLENDGTSVSFQGNFDGNGLTVYNLYTGTGRCYGGLFPVMNTTAQSSITVKNVTVAASHIGGYHGAGAVAGLVNTSNTSTKFYFEKCVVKNSFIYDNNDTNAATKRIIGILAGEISHNAANINNCLAVDIEISAAGIKGGFFGNNSNYAGKSTVSNSVVIGTTAAPVSAATAFATKMTEVVYTNVYTDQTDTATGVTTLEETAMQGSSANENMSLAWNTDWAAGNEGELPYPIIVSKAINFLPDGYDKWDGTTAEPTEVDAEGNIIINTAEELAWIALKGGDATKNNNYKVADDAKYFDMDGMSGITLNSTVADVKAAAKTTKYWRLDADAQTPAFQGNFDGNGLTVYNLYTGTGRGYAGLFPVVHTAALGSLTIKNVTVTASHIGAYHNTGAIVGLANTSNTSTQIYFEKCVVKNNYIYDNNDQNSACERIAATIVGKLVHNAATFSNCLVADNEVSAQGIIGGFFGNNSNYAGVSAISNSISIGTTVAPVSITTALATKVAETVYTNVYTDQPLVSDGITALATDDMKGAAAKVSMSLAWDTDWKAGEEGEYPSVIITKPIVEELPEGYDKWDGTTSEPTEVDAEGNIIINTAEELAWIALKGGDATANNNYKVADDAKYFDMDGMSGITLDSTVADVKAAAKTTKYWRLDTDAQTPAFQGNFDGNGLTVYNLYTNTGRGYGGLFPTVNTTAQTSISISNITVTASHVGGYHSAGAIFGHAFTSNTSTKIFLENCVVKNCFIYDNDSQNSACNRIAGVFAGQLTHNAATFNNCLAVDNEVSAQGIIGGFFGNNSAYAGVSAISNSISIGTAVAPVAVGGSLSAKVAETKYTNVYTDQPLVSDGITALATDDMKGAAAQDNMNLNWGITWQAGAEGEYPSLILENDFYDEWDGTAVEPTTTDEEGNIIIKTAEELAWVALKGGTATQDKSYKVADGIKYFNMNGMSGITPNSTVDDVRAAELNDTYRWRTDGDNKNVAFGGNFDGNGVVIYNLYSGKGYGYGGLFPVVKQSAEGLSSTIENVKVIASYIVGYHTSAAIVGIAEGPSSSAKLTLENIVVNNCFVSDNNDSNSACQRTASTLVGNVTHNTTTIKNCFVSDNDIISNNIYGGFIGNSSAYSAGVAVSDSIIIGTPAASVDILIDDAYAINTPVIEAAYTNVYADEYANDSINVLELDEMKGADAAYNMNLDWANAWVATSDYPELRAFHNITITDNEDGTHGEACDDCDIANDAVEHTFKDGYCVCGAECSHDELNDAVEENRTDATCKVAGSYESVVTCAVCGAEVSRVEVEIPVLDHTEAVKEENRVESTCTTPGSYDKITYCSVCDTELDKETITLELDPDNHVYGDDDICDECGINRDPIMSGDVNDDKIVNNKDLAVLMQKLNGWNVTISDKAADVTGDEIVNNKDYALLMQYVNGWDVELK